jgi:hypothetical protein
MADKIICPQCQCEIEITEALTAQLRGRLRKDWEADQRKLEAELARREAALVAAQKQVEAETQSLDEKVRKRLEESRAALETQARDKAKAELAVQIASQSDELKVLKSKLEQAQTAELQLLKQKRELESQKQELELHVAREMEKERAKIRDEAKKEISDERALKDAENNKLISDLKRQIEDLRRKAEQGSQQNQGEVMELELEELIAQNFPFDTVTAVGKGIRGADVLQTVNDPNGTVCGLILWESKNAKNFGSDWLEKLRDDQRQAKAQVSILVTVELPDGMQNFGQKGGVWIASRACAIPLASALRAGLVELAKASRTQAGRNGKMEQLYDYLSGTEFRHRVEGIVEAFMSLKTDLESEKRAQQRAWAKREKQLDRAIAQTAGMYGDLQGIAGASLPAIESLQWNAIEHKDSDTDS